MDGFIPKIKHFYTRVYVEFRRFLEYHEKEPNEFIRQVILFSLTGILFYYFFNITASFF
tara:strand:+ start:519 stop:695 length:177 start_codon:yes stop_codon:yes gene_type:complete